MTGRPWSFVVTAEHGGNVVPPEYAHLFSGAEKTLASHRGWDPGTLAGGATLVGPEGAVLVVDGHTAPGRPQSLAAPPSGMLRVHAESGSVRA